MSGEAGATIDGALYRVFVGAGVIVSLALDPDQPDGHAAYYAREEAPYRAWLERARAGLDELFEDLDRELPLAPVTEDVEQIDGAIIEDGADDHAAARHFAEYHQGGPLLLFLDGRNRLGIRSLRVRIAVTERVRRSVLELLLDRVAEVLRECEGDDA